MPNRTTPARRRHRALRRLAELAAAQGIGLELAWCHGAVITLVHGTVAPAPRRTRVVEASSRAMALVDQVTAEQRLPADWLKEDVKFYVTHSGLGGRGGSDVFGPHVILSVADPEPLLAMKLHACQTASPAAADLSDLRFLLGKMGVASLDEVERVYRRFFPRQTMNGEVRRLVAAQCPTAI
jgi:hypothetical protein